MACHCNVSIPICHCNCLPFSEGLAQGYVLVLLNRNYFFGDAVLTKEDVMTTIYEDKHSLYIKLGGSYFRPVLPKPLYGYPVYTDGKEIGSTKSEFTAYEKVDAKIILHSPHVKLSRDNFVEYWHSHGEYYSYNLGSIRVKIPSEDAWHPKK
jgi:hypothetical protein